MNGHERISALIAVYDSLSHEERARVEQHSKTCPACRDSLAAYQQMDASLSSLVDPQPDIELRPNFYARLEAERPKQNGIGSSFPMLFRQFSAQLVQAGAIAIIAVIVFSMWLALRSRPNQPAAIPSLPTATSQPTINPTLPPTATTQPATATPSPAPPIWTIQLQETLSAQLNLVRAVTFGQQGKLIAASGSSFQNVVWEQTGYSAAYEPSIQTGLDYSFTINDLAYSSGGYLAVGGANGSAGFLSVRDNISGEETVTLPTAVPAIQSLAFSNSGDIIAIGTDSGSNESATVHLWLLDYGDRLYELAFEGGDVSDIAFSPDDTLIAAASASGVHLWQVVGNEPLQTLTAEYGSPPFSTLTFSPDGNALAAGTRDGDVYIWQVADGQLIYYFDTDTQPLQSLAFSADGQQLATAASNGQVTVWQFDEVGPEQQFSGQTAERVGLATDIIFTDAAVLVAVGLSNGQVQLWQITHPLSSE